MTCQLVLIHGRSQQFKDGAALKEEWLASLERGARHCGLALPLARDAIHFPYYGQALFDLAGDPAAQAEILVRGAPDPAQDVFMRQVLAEICSARELDCHDAALDDPAQHAIDRGAWHHAAVRSMLGIIDQRLPHIGAAAIALATRDVYQYLHNPGIASIIDEGVRAAIPPGLPTVVVAHSLGTVVAYNLLRREGAALGWRIPLFITLGSPLAVRAIRNALRPIRFPACTAAWMNARDPRDIVALHALDRQGFDISPAIANLSDVDNQTDNRHGISGYLDDPRVARAIVDAVTDAD